MSYFRQRPKKKTGQEAKMGNTAQTCALGHSHRSKLESAVCQILQLRAKAGEIEILQIEDHIYLSDARIGYVADFRCRYLKSGEEFWVEAKGFANDRWPIKKKLYRFYGPGPLEIWNGHWRNPTLDEVIIPRPTSTALNAAESVRISGNPETQTEALLLAVKSAK